MSISEAEKAKFLAILEDQKSIIKGMLRSYSRTRADVEDIMQELYVRILQFLDKTSSVANIAETRGYIFRTARNIAIDMMRKKRPVNAIPIEYTVDEVTGVIEYELPDPTPHIERQISSEEHLKEVMIVLKMVPQPARRYFLLNTVYGMSATEIGKQHNNLHKRSVERYVASALRIITIGLGNRLPDFACYGAKPVED